MSPCRIFVLDTYTYTGLALTNWAHYSATSAFSTNSLRRRSCKPTRTTVNHVTLLEKLHICCRLRPALHLANPWSV